jgi:undecaprenyl diphosphate synthase
VTEDALRGALWGSDIPDPDLIIRPGGEKRLSNFLLWQGAYAELFFTDTFWPDFTKEEFSRILDEYHARERRRGK